MEQHFKLQKKAYYKSIKQMLFRGGIFCLFFIVLMFGIFYFTNTEFKNPLGWGILIVLIPPIAMVALQIFQGWRQAKINHKSYKISFDENSILLEQVVFWNHSFFSSPSISHRRLLYREITEIRKSDTGYYTIKGQADSYPNTLLISPNIENAKTFEETLSEIKPIKLHHEVNDLKEYPIKKISIFSSESLLFNPKYLSGLFGVYLVALLFSYFWFDPINWTLAGFLSLVYYLWMFFIFYIVVENNNIVFPIIMDKTALIIERIKGKPVAIPFKEITSVTKNSFQFIIVGKKISTTLPNQILIPINIVGLKSLEQKLNNICPIKYTD